MRSSQASLSVKVEKLNFVRALSFIGLKQLIWAVQTVKRLLYIMLFTCRCDTLPSWSHNTFELNLWLWEVGCQARNQKRVEDGLWNILQDMMRSEELFLTHSREYFLVTSLGKFSEKAHPPLKSTGQTLPISYSLGFFSLCSKLPESLPLRQLVQFQYFSALLGFCGFME